MSDPTGQTLTDAELLEQSAAGDRLAFETLVARHHASVYRLARLLARDEAEDVLQQTFLSAWRTAARFRGEASVRTWLLTIARNAAGRVRHRRVLEPVESATIDELGVEAGWGADDPETLAIASERREVLEAAFDALAADEREVLTLRDLEGLSGEDTAAVLGVTLAAMKSRLHRARMALAARVRSEVSRATRRT